MQVRVTTQLLFEASMHGHALILIKLDSDKEQDSQKYLQNDPEILATLLSLSCMLPIRDDSKHFLMTIRNVLTRVFAQ